MIRLFLLSASLLAAAVPIVAQTGLDLDGASAFARDSLNQPWQVPRTGYDALRDSTLVAMVMPMAWGRAVTIAFHYQGAKFRVAPDSLVLFITWRHDSRSFIAPSAGRQLLLLIDERTRLRIRATRLQSTLGLDSTDEQIAAWLPNELARRIGVARTVRFGYGPAEWALSRDEINAWHELMILAHPASSPLRH